MTGLLDIFFNVLNLKTYICAYLKYNSANNRKKCKFIFSLISLKTLSFYHSPQLPFQPVSVSFTTRQEDIKLSFKNRVLKLGLLIAEASL